MWSTDQKLVGYFIGAAFVALMAIVGATYDYHVRWIEHAEKMEQLHRDRMDRRINSGD